VAEHFTNFECLPIFTRFQLFVALLTNLAQGWIQRGAIAPLKMYGSNFFHHDFKQFGKQQSQYKAILPLIVLLQKCSCIGYFLSLTVMNP